MTHAKSSNDPSPSSPSPVPHPPSAPTDTRLEAPYGARATPVGIAIGEITVRVEPVKANDESYRSSLGHWAPSIVAVAVAVIGACVSLFAARITSITEADKTAVLRDKVRAELDKHAGQIQASKEATSKQLFAQTMEVLAKTADKDFIVAAPPLLSLCVQSTETDTRKMAFAALKILSYTCDDVCSSKEKQAQSEDEKRSAQSCWTACDSLKATIDEADNAKQVGCMSVAPPRTTGALKSLCIGEVDKGLDKKELDAFLEDQYFGLRAHQKHCACGFAKVFRDRKNTTLAADAQKKCDLSGTLRDP